MILKSAWGRQIFIVCMLSIFQLRVQAQERHLIKARESIIQKDFTDAKERLSKYAEKNGTGAEYQFVTYLLLSRQAFSYEDFQKADDAYKACKNGLAALTDADNWCKEISLCDSTLSNELNRNSIASFKAIESSPTIDGLEDYLVRFEKSPLKIEATEMRDRMRFDEANVKHSIEAYEQYKKQYSTVEYTNAAQDSIHSIAFKNAISENTVAGMKSFLEIYPKAAQVNAAKQRLIDLEWTNAKTTATVDGYKEFIKLYPFSKYEDQAKDEIENLIWEKAVQINTVDEYNSYLLTYPAGKFVLTANEKLDNLYWETMENSNSAAAIRHFIASRPNSPRIKEAMQKLETAIWETAEKSQSEEDLRNYLREYPTGTYKSQAESALDQTIYTSLNASPTAEELQAYLKEFPNGVGRDDVEKKLEEIHWKETSSKATIAAYEGFLAEHPNSSHKNEVTERLDDLKNFILPFFNNNKKYQLYNVAESKTIDVQEYDNMYPTSVKTFVVERARKYGVISKSGAIIIPLKFDCLSFDGRFYKAFMGEKMALLNLIGEEISPERFTQAQSLNKELYKVYTTDNKGALKCAIMKVDGQFLAPFKYEYLDELVLNDRIIGYIGMLGGLTFLLNDKLEVVSKGFESIYRNYQLGSDPQSQYCVFKDNSKAGLIDLNGKVILPAMYDNINFLNPGYLAVSKGDKYGIVKPDNSVVLPIGRYTGVGLLSDDFVGVFIDNPEVEYGSYVKIYNLKKQQFISETLFDECKTVTNTVFAATKDNRMQLLNEEGKTLLSIDEFTNAVEDNYFTDTAEGDGADGIYSEDGEFVCFPSVFSGDQITGIYELPKDSSDGYMLYYEHSEKGRFKVYLDKNFKVINKPANNFDKYLGTDLTFSAYYPDRSLFVAQDINFKQVLIDLNTGQRKPLPESDYLYSLCPAYQVIVRDGVSLYQPNGSSKPLVGDKVGK
jgi:outer membrane protein assembly factor BamD (BamD/ComL family)